MPKCYLIHQFSEDFLSEQEQKEPLSSSYMASESPFHSSLLREQIMTFPSPGHTVPCTVLEETCRL